MAQLPTPVTAAQAVSSNRRFTVLLSATRRGARLARWLTVQQLADWDRPYDTAEQIVAELAANAIQHGRVPGRDFRLTVVLDADGMLRIEVTDARADRMPTRPSTAEPDAQQESGRGLLIVDTLADLWGVDLSPGTPTRKTVWATLAPATPPSPPMAGPLTT
ncbi:ATP-binding protein [Streptomyces sp. ISL-1]|nr:ATP-binding protein [Streptomyces sp. ISL-1]MBT2392318.1 ATP-binding protein [Streptomyces sp. ISL-1]